MILLLLNGSIESTSLVALTGGLKYSVNHAINRRAGIYALFLHLQGTCRVDRKILKGPRIWGIVVSTGFNLKSSVALACNKSVSLSLEALKPGIDFSLAMKVLDGILK